jgi:hypothetical protein
MPFMAHDKSYKYVNHNHAFSVHQVTNYNELNDAYMCMLLPKCSKKLQLGFYLVQIQQCHALQLQINV